MSRSQTEKTQVLFYSQMDHPTVCTGYTIVEQWQVADARALPATVSA